jgi:hypothetical protein
MIMQAVENKIFEVLKDLEIKLKSQAVFYDDSPTRNVDDIEYFKNEALEHFDKSADKIEGIIFNEIKTFIDKKIDVHSLPKIVTATDIEEFKDSILDSINEYPVLIEYTETLDFTLVHWEPMYLAIRRYFNVGVISKISSRDEFLLALIGYRNLEYIYYDHLEQMPKKEIHSEINMLVKNSFATLDEAQELKDLKLLWPE